MSPISELNDTLSNMGLNLTLPEVAERLGISIKAARALVEASLKSFREEA